MDEIYIHQETGRVITVQEYRVVAFMVQLLVKLDVMKPKPAFDIIMRSFDKIFV